MLRHAGQSILFIGALIAHSSFAWASDMAIIWDGTSELAMTARVTDSVTHKPVSGATVRAVRVGGRNTEPLTSEHPSAMPPPQKTDRDGHARRVAYFRAAGDAA